MSSVDELSAIISYYGVRHSKPAHNTSPYKVLYILGKNGCEWFSLDPFGEVVYSN